ncbi:uncharacterized protein LOC143143847 [Ptiloglossa arizonensis]|uniref:uncharacterized protein LOC143143847 n=1 Tax=Ptiloglossa arizonensis TaxID=3350558 RepID=UPI003FA11B2A
MISQWRSMMDNLSDVYYLVQLIVRQIFVYLRDMILYKFIWLVTANDEIDYTDSKLRGLTSRNITADVLAFVILCTVLFLIVMLASKCEKEEGQLYASPGIQPLSTDFQEEPYRVSGAGSGTSNCFYASGDSARSRGRPIPKRNFSDENFVRVRTIERKRNKSILKKSIFGLSGVQSLNSQSTQTEHTLHKNNSRWLVRRTRSGQIYGKYPV